MKETIHKICSTIFTISLPLFMLMGLVLVVVQFIAGLLGLGEIVLFAGNCEVYCIWMSVICGFAGFADHYVRPKKDKKK